MPKTPLPPPPTVSAILVAAGQGVRFGQDKILLQLGRKSVLQRSLDKFLPLLTTQVISEIIIVVSPKNKAQISAHLEQIGYLDQVKLVLGGQERWQSSLKGIQASTGQIVAIHDTARPFITTALIQETIKITHAATPQAALVAVPCTNSVKIVNNDGQNVDSLPRSQVWLAQTPQVFSRKLILSAYQKALTKKYQQMTDESELITKFLHQPVTIVPGSEDNLKITFTTDLPLAQRIATLEDQQERLR